jgi:hypothetical protein
VNKKEKKMLTFLFLLSLALADEVILQRSAPNSACTNVVSSGTAWTSNNGNNCPDFLVSLPLKSAIAPPQSNVLSVSLASAFWTPITPSAVFQTLNVTVRARANVTQVAVELAEFSVETSNRQRATDSTKQSVPFTSPGATYAFNFMTQPADWLQAPLSVMFRFSNFANVPVTISLTDVKVDGFYAVDVRTFANGTDVWLFDSVFGLLCDDLGQVTLNGANVANQTFGGAMFPLELRPLVQGVLVNARACRVAANASPPLALSMGTGVRRVVTVPAPGATPAPPTPATQRPATTPVPPTPTSAVPTTMSPLPIASTTTAGDPGTTIAGEDTTTATSETITDGSGEPAPSTTSLAEMMSDAAPFPVAIVAGAVGGAIALLVVVALVVFLVRRSRNQKSDDVPNYKLKDPTAGDDDDIIKDDPNEARYQSLPSHAGSAPIPAPIVSTRDGTAPLPVHIQSAVVAPPPPPPQPKSSKQPKANKDGILYGALSDVTPTNVTYDAFS